VIDDAWVCRDELRHHGPIRARVAIIELVELGAVSFFLKVECPVKGDVVLIPGIAGNWFPPENRP